MPGLQNVKSSSKTIFKNVEFYLFGGFEYSVCILADSLTFLQSDCYYFLNESGNSQPFVSELGTLVAVNQTPEGEFWSAVCGHIWILTHMSVSEECRMQWPVCSWASEITLLLCSTSSTNFIFISGWNLRVLFNIMSWVLINSKDHLCVIAWYLEAVQGLQHAVSPPSCGGDWEGGGSPIALWDRRGASDWQHNNVCFGSLEPGIGDTLNNNAKTTRSPRVAWGVGRKEGVRSHLVSQGRFWH